MIMSAKILLGGLLALVPIAAMARTPYVAVEQRFTAEQRHATGLDTLSPEQLALLNRLLSEDTAKTVESAVAESHDAAAEPGSPGRGFIGLDDTTVVSKVVGDLAGWEPGTVFELQNGQKWKVLKGSATLKKPLQSPEIQVIPGLAGRWFLQVDENLPKARVYRID
jgi:hypothetical protein